MKRIVALIVLFTLLATPLMTLAQDDPVIPTVRWTIRPTHSVYWIGEGLTAFVNGSVNSSFLVEVRPYTVNHTIGNATYRMTGTTNENGTCWITIDKIDIEGEYRLQVMENQMVVCWIDVMFNYDPQRWNEIQIERLDYENWKRDQAIANMTTNIIFQNEKISSLKEVNKLLLALFLVCVTLSVPAWLDIYRKRCDTKKKRSRMLELIGGIEENRRLYYGGVKSGQTKPLMYGEGVTTCAKANLKDHDLKTCPHCELDDLARKFGLAGMNHEKMVAFIGGGKKVKKIQPKKLNWYERKVIAHEFKAKTRHLKKVVPVVEENTMIPEDETLEDET